MIVLETKTKIYILLSNRSSDEDFIRYKYGMREAIKREIDLIKERNTSVEMDKAREISRARKICIVICTYAIMVIFFYGVRFSNPRVNALVPTLGFILSTLSLGLCKKIWIKYHK